MPHAFITIAIPFNAEFVGETAETVKRIGNPFEATSRAKLAKSGIVHFASLTIVPPQPSGQSAHLVMEMSADGDADQAIGALADALGHNLADALDAARVDWSAEDPKAFIADPRYRLNPGVGWFGDLGIVYTGTPGMTVRRILDEAELAKALTPILYQPDVLCKASALERLRAVREQIEKQADFKPLLTVETAPFLGGDQATPLGATRRHPRLAGLGHLLASHAVSRGGRASNDRLCRLHQQHLPRRRVRRNRRRILDAGGLPSADSWASGGAVAVAPVARKRGYP